MHGHLQVLLKLLSSFMPQCAVLALSKQTSKPLPIGSIAVTISNVQQAWPL